MLAIFNFAANIDSNPFVIKLVGALLILLIGFIIGRIVALLVRRLMHELAVDEGIKKTVSYRFSLERQISSLIEIIIYIITIIFMLNYLRVTVYVLLGILGIMILFFLIAFFLSLRDFLPNLFSGLRIRSKKPFVVGDTLKVKTFSGKVKKLTLFVTTIEDDGDILQIPNMLFDRENYVVNAVTKSNAKKRKASKKK